MRKLSNVEEIKKARMLRITDKTWNKFASLKQREKTWELFIEELLQAIKFFKGL